MEKIIITCAILVISGCAGVGGVFSSSKDYINSSNKYYADSIELARDHKDESLSFNLRYNPNVKGKKLSESEALHDWGAPYEVTSDTSHTIWTYQGRRSRWNGLLLHALVTIPLAVPAGKEKYALYFKEGKLEKLVHHSSSTSIFMCDPIYMVMGAMAAGMMSTGSGGNSSPGLCSVIHKQGLYFHYLTNY